MDLTSEQMAELRELAGSRDVPADVALRARIVLWSGEGRRRKDIAELAGVSPLTVDRCRTRYAERGLAGFEEKRRGGPRTQVPPQVRARVIALTRMSPPAESGLSHWSTRTLADHLKRREGVSVSWHYVARIWREENLKPHRSGTFKISKDPAFAEKVADVVGLYLAPPGGAVVLSIDEKTQVQALDRTQPVLPVTFAATEKRTHDYVRHGTTNLFAALNVTTGEVLGECKPNRNGATFLAFLKKAVKPHTGKEIHVVLDNLSTHTTPDVKEWLAKNPHVHFHFTPVGSSWLNQIEIWFGIITRQSIRRGTFASVNVLVKQIRDYINSWNQNAKPFTWTATADEILAKVRLVQASVKKLVNNNSK
ncbi:IS630 family transposase (plasmid) [Streptomyces globisporus]|uniref:IS630 family transposase n=1 Tax=Streptomyces globisporus TaxID=1908 RepID=UPI002F90ACB6|nr:IS630 family transposase [Streptomyces globisporus]WSU86142.1 IS630 family transposase [Streptomyces globisporus]WSU86242.1 IS630 family transposase [Streptomyces globisporus]WSU86383.1 IS630 family transposase [Streptomyces globisporus]WSU86421.1 IS630 family transposase [Streptomyces globisporus]